MQQDTQGPILQLALFALGLGLGGGALAQETPSWSLSGFGTLGVVHSTEDQADYTSNVLKPNGAGVSRAWSGDVDSRLGAQLDLSLNRQWSAVLQVVSEQGLDGSYRPRVEWANIKVQLTPELALRAGRIALPMFLTADYRKIGYIYPSLRPPVETYGVLPFTNSDGVDATWRWSAGRVRNAAQFFYGHGEMNLAPPHQGWARGIVGISNTSDWGALSLRASLISAELTMDTGEALFQSFDALGPAGQALGRRYAVDHKRSAIAGIGLEYDPGPWFLMAEAGASRAGSLLGSTRSAYASAGWRWRTLTPYLTYARVRATGATHDAGLSADEVAPLDRTQAALLDAELNACLANIPQQTTASAGLRWDWQRNAALTLQYDRVTPRDGSHGTLINTTPGFASGHPANVLSLALDFVY